jgi:serine-type D-Ala-D-Ala carboxypeptidase (penicillin-binding protein 5/6)
MFFRDRRYLVALPLIFSLTLLPGLALARKAKPVVKTVKPPHETSKPSAKPKTVAAPGAKEKQAASSVFQIEGRAAVLMDGLTGQVLYEQDPGLKIAPASFVKVLTLFVVYDAIKAGQLKMDAPVTVSQKAWKTQGSKMFVKVGEAVKVEDLIKGIAIASGNDACIALAEHMAGSEEAFVKKMNEKAQQIGMKDSVFQNCHGMPAEGQVTTAMDMAVLAKRYIEAHPESLAIHSTVEFEYNGIKQQNRNTLLQKNIGVDGLKTGHVEESGYHLVATAKRGNMRLIAVGMGFEKIKIRGSEVQKLLEYGFKNFVTLDAVKKGGTVVSVKVRRGKVDELPLAAAEDVQVTVARGKEKQVTTVPQLPPFASAPIKKGQTLAKVVVQNEGKTVKEVNLLATADVERSFLSYWPIMAAVLMGLCLAGAAVWFFQRYQKKKFA